MKTKTITTQQKARGAVLPSLAILGMLLMAPSANAATAIPYIEDFEVPNNNLNNWTEVDNSVGSGTGNSFVLFANGSNGGFAEKSGANNIILYQDFDYDATFRLSFRMQAQADSLVPDPLAIGGGSAITLESSSGVIISFFKTSDSTLAGSQTISNASNNIADIGSGVASYSDLLSTWATNAGVVVPVSTFSLEFFAAGETDPGNALRRSTSSVWFDDVKVVPVPASIWLLGSGLAGLIGVARRKKASV